jgi:hypothetical protein
LEREPSISVNSKIEVGVRLDFKADLLFLLTLIDGDKILVFTPSRRRLCGDSLGGLASNPHPKLL